MRDSNQCAGRLEAGGSGVQRGLSRGLGVALVGILAWTGCGRWPGRGAGAEAKPEAKGAAGPGAKGGAARPVPVRVATAEEKPVPRQIRTFGSAEAYATVTIRSQVTGQIMRAHVEPGQAVKAGDLLFSVDTRPFEAALKQLEAVMAKNRVLADESERQAKIAAELSQRKVASSDEMARARAAAEAQRAALAVDQANIDRARLDLEYCTIKAPITGRSGDVLLREGSVVKANDLAMVVLAQTVPIYVSFAVPQVHLPDIRRYLAAGSVEVAAAVPGQAEPPATGALVFIDNTVDESTGTIRLKARFENASEPFWPGEFLDVVLTLTRDEKGVVIPSEAVQRGQGGSVVFVVKPDQSVELRRVTVRRTIGDESLIDEGVQAGETVVTDGQLRLVPGARIEVAGEGGAAPAAAAGGKGGAPEAAPAAATGEKGGSRPAADATTGTARP